MDDERGHAGFAFDLGFVTAAKEATRTSSKWYDMVDRGC